MPDACLCKSYQEHARGVGPIERAVRRQRRAAEGGCIDGGGGARGAEPTAEKKKLSGKPTLQRAYCTPLVAEIEGSGRTPYFLFACRVGARVEMGVVFPNKRRDLGGISFFRASGMAMAGLLLSSVTRFGFNYCYRCCLVCYTPEIVRPMRIHSKSL